MRYDEYGQLAVAFGEFFDGLYDLPLGPAVERGGRLVEEQHRCLFVEGTRDADALPLLSIVLSVLYSFPSNSFKSLKSSWSSSARFLFPIFRGKRAGLLSSE